MKQFLFLCFVASGILFSDANGANLKRSKFINFDTGTSVLNADSASTELSPTINYDDSDNVWFFRPQTEVHMLKAVKPHKFHCIMDSEDDDEMIFELSEDDSEIPEAPANTPYEKTTPKEHYIFGGYTRNFSTSIANDAF